MKIHSFSLKGDRSSNEDVVVVKKIKSSGEILGGLFDGHGGRFVSTFLGDNLFRTISQKYSVSQIQYAIRDLQTKLVHKHPKESAECGSTLLACRFIPDTRTLQVINLGDSRAVLRTSTGVSQLTTDHKPETMQERYRISKVGEKVLWDKEDEVYRVNGYSVSRAMGDASAPGISQDCDVRTTKWSSSSKYVIMACDGVWDVMTSEEACAVVDRYETVDSFETTRSKKNVAYMLAKEAYKKGSGDNISVLIFFFN